MHYPYHPYYYPYYSSGQEYLRVPWPLQKSFTISNQNYVEYMDSKCYKIVKGIVKCTQNPLGGIPFQVKEFCTEQPPEMEGYKCVKRRIVNLKAELSLYYDNALSATVQQPNTYNCLANSNVLNQAGKAFEQSIPTGAIITDSVLKTAAKAAEQRYVDLVTPCGIKAQVVVGHYYQVISDWAEVK